MSVESWVRAWRAVSSRQETSWLIHQARERGETLEAMRGLLRATFPEETQPVAEPLATPPAPGERVGGLSSTHPEEED